MTGGDGTLAQFIVYMPFGEALVNEQLVTHHQPYKFTGKPLDIETGLYYFGARYYCPVTARWYGVDPLAMRHPAIAPYVYCANNPVIKIYPDGRDWYQVVDGEGNTVKNSQPVFFVGSERREGFTNIGTSALSIDPLGNQRSFNADGSITNSVLLPQVTVGRGNAQGQGGNGFGIANNIIGGAGVVNGLVGFDAAINSKHAYRYAQRINGRVVSAAELTATNQAKALKVLNVSKSIGNKLGVAGGLVIAGDVLYNSEVKASHGINAVMTGIAFTGWGAPVAGIWFVADFGTGLITGKSISDRIDSRVGAPLVDWDW